MMFVLLHISLRERNKYKKTRPKTLIDALIEYIYNGKYNF